MRVLVIGPTGSVGRHVVQRALDEGHEVTALARRPEAITITGERLTVVKGGVLDPSSLEAAVRGQEAVLCCLGSRELKANTVCSEGMRNLVEAMMKAGVRRLVVLSSSAVLTDTAFVFEKIIKPLFLGRAIADKVRQEEVVEASGLDWVLVRPARLTDGSEGGKVRVEFDRHPTNGTRISRLDVAAFMVEQLSSDRYLHKAPTIAY